MSDVNVEVKVFIEPEANSVAKIALNGYNIGEGSVFGRNGAMRSFKVVEGDVWDFWDKQTILTIRDDAGTESKIRIFAAPAQKGASGFVEFL